MMFELPNAKRVKRAKLFSTASSSEDEADDANGSTAIEHETAIKSSHLSESEPRSKSNKSSRHKYSVTLASHQDDEIQVNYGFEYEYIDKSATAQLPKPSDTTTKLQDSNEPQVYAFNLFAPTLNPKNSTTDNNSQQPSPVQSTQITLRPQSPPITSLLPTSQPIESGRILTSRPLSHYFTAHLPAPTIHALREQYRKSAISGQSLLSLTPTSWPGTHLPWRVIHIPRHKLTLRDPTLTKTNAAMVDINTNTAARRSSTSPPTSKPQSRPRPSKNRRIKLRERQKHHAALALASQQAAATLAETEREKRTRRNREKKVKRKVREKEKKVAAMVEGEKVNGAVENQSGNGDGKSGDDIGMEDSRYAITVD